MYQFIQTDGFCAVLHNSQPELIHARQAPVDVHHAIWSAGQKVLGCFWVVLRNAAAIFVQLPQNSQWLNVAFFDTLREQYPLVLWGWNVSDDHTSVQWFRQANALQLLWWTLFIDVVILSLINTWAICEWLVRARYLLLCVVRLRALLGGDCVDRVGRRWRVIQQRAGNLVIWN